MAFNYAYEKKKFEKEWKGNRWTHGSMPLF